MNVGGESDGGVGDLLAIQVEMLDTYGVVREGEEVELPVHVPTVLGHDGLHLCCLFGWLMSVYCRWGVSSQCI